jgi:hypothetical protein
MSWAFRSAMLVTCFHLGCPALLLAQLPATRLDGVFPSGANPGTSLDVTLVGADLDDVDQLLFSHAGITSSQKMAEKTGFDETLPIENQFAVTIAAATPPGIYEVRCRGIYGISGPRKFVVSQIAQVSEVEPNNEPEAATKVATLPVIVNGQLNGNADIDWIRFTGTANQGVTIEAMAQRLDSPAAATIGLYSADGQLISEGRKGANKDFLLQYRLPATGDYLIRVQELLYRGGGHYTYQLTIGNSPTIDSIFPPAGIPGSNAEYTVFGQNLPGGSPSLLSLHGQPLEQLKVRISIPADIEGKLTATEPLMPHQAGLDGMEYRFIAPSGPSNPLLLTIATAPLVNEEAENDTPNEAQKLKLPCEVMGRFYPQRDADWFSFDATAGDEYWLEVYSHRLGLPTDVTMLVQRVESIEGEQDKVTQLGWVDDVNKRDGGFEFDQRTHDPIFQFKAPADGSYRIMLRESHSSVVSDPRLVYRLAVRAAKPDFRIAAVPMDSSGALFLRKGGREAINVVIFRQDGFDGAIVVSASGLPPGVSAADVTVGPGCNQAAMILTAAVDAPPQESQISLVGKSVIGGVPVTRSARTGHPLAAVPFATPLNTNQASVPSKLTNRMPLIVSDRETERVILSVADPGEIETSRGGIVKLKYTVARDGNAGGNVVAYPFGGPSSMQVRSTNIGGNNEGEAEIRFPATMPPGTYSMNLVATIQGMKYVRNPESLVLIKKRQERINKLVADAKTDVQAKQKLAAQTQATLSTATTEFSKVKSDLATKEQAAKAAEVAKTAVDNLLQSATKKSQENPEDESLKQNVITSAKTAEEANAKLQTANTQTQAATEQLDKRMKTQAEATTAKAASDEALKVAQQFERDATLEKSKTDRNVRTVEQAVRERNVNHLIYSQPVTISVAENPYEMGDAPDQKTKQGDKSEFTIPLKRLYGFNSTVTSQFTLPKGITGLQVQAASVANGKNEIKVTVTAAANATPGDHQIILRTSLTFNGQRLTGEHPFRITVEEVVAEKK